MRHLPTVRRNCPTGEESRTTSERAESHAYPRARPPRGDTPNNSPRSSTTTNLLLRQTTSTPQCPGIPTQFRSTRLTGAITNFPPTKVRDSRPESQGWRTKARESKPESRGHGIKARGRVRAEESRPESQGQQVKNSEPRPKDRDQSVKTRESGPENPRPES